MKNIYIIVSSYSYEGGIIRGIYDTRSEAERAFDNGYYFGDWHDLLEVPINDSVDISVEVEPDEKYSIKKR